MGYRRGGMCWGFINPQIFLDITIMFCVLGLSGGTLKCRLIINELNGNYCCIRLLSLMRILRLQTTMA